MTDEVLTGAQAAARYMARLAELRERDRAAASLADAAWTVGDAYTRGVRDGLTAALAALHGHGLHDTAHERVGRLLACVTCTHQPESHDQPDGSCSHLTLGPDRERSGRPVERRCGCTGHVLKRLKP